LQPSFFNHLDQFLVIGSNFTKANASVRSRLAVTPSKAESVYALACQKGLKDFLMLSTCNRTEFYAFAPFHVLRETVVEALHLTDEQLDSFFYTKSGINAVRHFFRVTSGLDSQIVGDYEIVGQVKKSVQVSRQFGLVGTLTDRISSQAFQSSKEIKAKTNISNGKYSVSYAAAELISSQQIGDNIRNILVVGTGETGQALARNLSEYHREYKLTLTNRTLSHAKELADELSAGLIAFEDFRTQLSRFDVVIMSVQSDEYLIVPENISGNSTTLFIDLSIPQVIDPKVGSLSGIKLYSIDEISAFHNELIKQRYLDIPKAELIIEDFIGKLLEWQHIFQHTGIILRYKEKMGRIIHNGGNPGPKIEKSFSTLIKRVKSEGYRGCSVIQTMNELIAFEK